MLVILAISVGHDTESPVEQVEGTRRKPDSTVVCAASALGHLIPIVYPTSARYYRGQGCAGNGKTKYKAQGTRPQGI